VRCVSSANPWDTKGCGGYLWSSPITYRQTHSPATGSTINAQRTPTGPTKSDDTNICACVFSHVQMKRLLREDNASRVAEFVHTATSGTVRYMSYIRPMCTCTPDVCVYTKDQTKRRLLPPMRLEDFQPQTQLRDACYSTTTNWVR
jgi:hypothetical protein